MHAAHLHNDVEYPIDICVFADPVGIRANGFDRYLLLCHHKDVLEVVTQKGGAAPLLRYNQDVSSLGLYEKLLVIPRITYHLLVNIAKRLFRELLPQGLKKPEPGSAGMILYLGIGTSPPDPDLEDAPC